VKARSVVFLAEADQIPDVERRIDNEVLPRFSAVPEFMGFVALQSEGSRPEIVAMSFWDDGLEESEAISESFRDEIERVTGSALARKEYNIIKMTMLNSTREVCLDWPMSHGADDRCPKGHRLVAGPLQAAPHPDRIAFCPTCNLRLRQQPDGTLGPVSDRSRH